MPEFLLGELPKFFVLGRGFAWREFLYPAV